MKPDVVGSEPACLVAIDAAIDATWKARGSPFNAYEVVEHIRKTYGETWLRQQLASVWERIVATFAQQSRQPAPLGPGINP
jgi:hypothetical protein